MKINGLDFHEQADGSLVCSHRDLSVCTACETAAGDGIIDVVGAHFANVPGLAEALLEVEAS